MRIGKRIVVGMMSSGVLLALVACGSRGGGGATAGGGLADTAEAVRLLRTPANPYGIIYHPPVDLTKRPDTTKTAPPTVPAARKARG
jgi:hypothetical protein